METALQGADHTAAGAWGWRGRFCRIGAASIGESCGCIALAGFIDAQFA
ncbi:hypothetical protein ACU4GD_06055 [Cupriavidus basilensis]